MVIEHGSYWLHHHKYIYKLFFVLPGQRLDVREEVEIVEVIKTIVEKPSFVPHKINTTNFHVSIKSEFWSRHSKMFALLQLRKKFGRFQLFPKVFILNIRIREPITGSDKTTVNSDISHAIDCSKVQPGKDILSNIHSCNAMATFPKSPSLRRSLSTGSLITLDPSKPQNTLSVLATPPKSLTAEEVSQSVLTKTSDAHKNCESDKQSSKDFTRSLQRKRKYGYGTGWQPPLKQMAIGSPDLWTWDMKFTIAEKKSKSFSSLLTTSEVRHTVHYFSDQTQYSYRYIKDNVLKDRTNTLKALIKKYEMDINFKFRNNSITNTVESVSDSQMKESTHLSLDENKTVDCNSSTDIFASSCTDENISISCTNDSVLTDSCTYKNVSVACKNAKTSGDICRKDNDNLTVSSENTSIEHCGSISDIPSTIKETFEGKDIKGHNVTNESNHSNHSGNELHVVSKCENISDSLGESEEIKVAENGSVPSVAYKLSDENVTNNCEKIVVGKDSCLNIEEKTDGRIACHLSSAGRGNNANVLLVANSDTSSVVETSSSRINLRNDYTASGELAHYMKPENGGLNQGLCMSNIFNTFDNNSCSHLTTGEAVEETNIEYFAKDSFIMFGDAFKTGFERDLADTNISEENKCIDLVSSVSNPDTNTKRCERRLRQYTDTLPLNTMIYPRPLDYNHVLTRRQFENKIKIFEDKVLLTVEELTSSNSMLTPELRTRSMKGRSVNLKKLLQDLHSYPTVVLHRLEDQYRK